MIRVETNDLLEVSFRFVVVDVVQRIETAAP
jgi:hypothetical protein